MTLLSLLRIVTILPCVYVRIQVCAANLSPSNVIFVSLSSFAVPASLVLIISLAIIVARRRHDVVPGKPITAPLDFSRFGPGELHDYDVIEDIGNAPKHHVTIGSGKYNSFKNVTCIYLFIYLLKLYWA